PTVPTERPHPSHYSFFISNPASTEIYTLSLHDALPISTLSESVRSTLFIVIAAYNEEGAIGSVVRELRTTYANVVVVDDGSRDQDRKSTRLNSSHVEISYAVFCLKKKKK